MGTIDWSICARVESKPNVMMSEPGRGSGPGAATGAGFSRSRTRKPRESGTFPTKAARRLASDTTARRSAGSGRAAQAGGPPAKLSQASRSRRRVASRMAACRAAAGPEAAVAGMASPAHRHPPQHRSQPVPGWGHRPPPHRVGWRGRSMASPLRRPAPPPCRHAAGTQRFGRGCGLRRGRTRDGRDGRRPDRQPGHVRGKRLQRAGQPVRRRMQIAAGAAAISSTGTPRAASPAATGWRSVWAVTSGPNPAPSRSVRKLPTIQPTGRPRYATTGPSGAASQGPQPPGKRQHRPPLAVLPPPREVDGAARKVAARPGQLQHRRRPAGGARRRRQKRIKSFCGAKPPRKLRWTDAGRCRLVVGYGDFTQDAGWRGR